MLVRDIFLMVRYDTHGGYLTMTGSGILVLDRRNWRERIVPKRRVLEDRLK